MSNGWQGGERRGQPRVALGGKLQGKIETAIEAPVMDLSLSGALIEVPSALPANARYSLKLPVTEREFLDVGIEVVRSYVHGFDKDDAGHPAVRYRAAIKFVELSEAQRQGLTALMDKGRGDGLRAQLSS